MKKIICLVLALALSLCACSSEKIRNIFDTINFKDGYFTIDDVTIGKTTFSDLEKIYTEVNIEDLENLYNFEVPYTLIIDDTTIEMTKTYSFGDSTDSNQNQIADYDEIKDVQTVCVDMISNKTFDKETAEKYADKLAEKCKEKFGEPTETSDAPPSKIVSWKLEEGKTIGISTLFEKNSWKIKMGIYLHPSVW